MNKLVQKRDSLLAAAKKEEREDKLAIELCSERPGTVARDAYSDAADLANWFVSSGLSENQIKKIAVALEDKPKEVAKPKPKAKPKKDSK